MNQVVKQYEGKEIHVILDNLCGSIENFITSYNEDARPFIWTKSAVHQKRLTPSFAV